MIGKAVKVCVRVVVDAMVLDLWHSFERKLLGRLRRRPDVDLPEAANAKRVGVFDEDA